MQHEPVVGVLESFIYLPLSINKTPMYLLEEAFLRLKFQIYKIVY